MDANRFDTWTRNRALRLSRRNALRLIGAGGVVTVLPVFTSDTLAEAACTLTIHAETTGGPPTPATYDGTLQFTLGADGVFTQAAFTSASGETLSVTGQAIGRAIDLQITLAAGQVLVLSGTSEQPIGNCQGAAAGILTGPQPGDLGVWQATSGTDSISGSSSGTTAPPPTPVQSSSETNGNSNSGNNSGSGNSTCVELHSQCNASAECCSGWCTDNECRSCGDTICGEDCIVLSDNVAHCGQCFNACNTDTQSCVDGMCTGGDDSGGDGAACLPDASPCNSPTDCCSQTCNFGLCGCGKLGQSCNESINFFCCEGTPVVCLNNACCIINGSACMSDADCCDYQQGNGSCKNGICTRNA